MICLLLLALPLTAPGVLDQTASVLLKDDFNRSEKDPDKEQVGNGWTTNSKSRAQGVKQVDLADNALKITKAAVADHGVSVVHEMAFQNATIKLKFQLGAKDDLGINIADMKEKSVHAGHICVARVRLNSLEIQDLKTGNMKLEHRNARKAGKVPAELESLLKTKRKRFKLKLTPDEWHELQVAIQGDLMIVKIDGTEAGRFQSEGIAHPTKSRLRLSVNKQAWVDDILVTGTIPPQ